MNSDPRHRDRPSRPPRRPAILRRGAHARPSQLPNRFSKGTRVAGTVGAAVLLAGSSLGIAFSSAPAPAANVGWSGLSGVVLTAEAALGVLIESATSALGSLLTIGRPTTAVTGGGGNGLCKLLGDCPPPSTTTTTTSSTTSTTTVATTSTSSTSSTTTTTTKSGGTFTPASLYTGTGTIDALANTTVTPMITFYDGDGNALTSINGETMSVSGGVNTDMRPVEAFAPPDAQSAQLTMTSKSALVVSNGSLTSQTVSEPTIVTPLTTSGNQVLQGNGKPIVFKGINLYGLEVQQTDSSITLHEIQQLKQWGANFVRVQMGEQLWLSNSCEYDPNYVSDVDQVVNWITGLGMIADLDLAFTNPTNCVGGVGPNTEEMADNPGSLSFWTQVATRYGGNPLVTFDLFNEPNTISDAIWLNGGPVGGVDGIDPTYQAAGMQQMYNAVRATGTNNVVIVTGNVYGNELPSTLVAGTNIVYAAHDYTCPNNNQGPPNCASPKPYNPSYLLPTFLAQAANVPIMISEFGWPNSNGTGNYINNVIALAQSEGWGYAAFLWDGVAGGGSFNLVSAVPATGPYQPTPDAMPLVAGLNGAKLTEYNLTADPD